MTKPDFITLPFDQEPDLEERFRRYQALYLETMGVRSKTDPLFRYTIKYEGIKFERRRSAFKMLDCRAVAPRRSRSLRFYGNAGYVYVIESKGGLYKIGRSSNAQKRFRSIKLTNTPFAGLSLLYIFFVDDMYHSEAFLHDMFKIKRIRKTEWFQLDDDDLEKISKLQRKSFIDVTAGFLPLFDSIEPEDED